MNVLSRVFRASGRGPIVVREADPLLASLREELRAASESDRPGLQRAVELVTALARLDDQAVLATWVQQQLREIDLGSCSEVESVRRLRQLHPDLGLLEATKLVRLATPSA